MNTRLLESIDIVAGFTNTDINTDATTDIVSLKLYDGCLVLITKPAGTADDDLVFALLQQTNVSGGSVKALNIKNLYAKIGTQTTTPTWVRYELTTAAATIDTKSFTGKSYTIEGNVGTDLAAADLLGDTLAAMFVIDVRASDLDVSNGFDCISLFMEGDEVQNALVANATFILYGARYPSRIPLSAITN